MKKILALTLALLLVCGMLPFAAFAQTKEDFEIKNGTLVKYHGNDTVVTVPEGVKKIKKEAFMWNVTIEEVIIPDSVKSIGERCFTGCSKLKKVTLPQGITELSDEIFSGCKALKEIDLPESLTKIGEEVFKYCNGLTEVTIPESVTEIGYCCFYSCKNLKKVTLPSTITELPKGGFQRCESLEEIEIPKTVTKVGGQLFARCSKLKDITLPKGLTLISNGMFAECVSLTEIEIPSSVKKIDDHAFRYCIGLTEVKIPEKVTYIGIGAFSQCENLTTLNVPKRVSSIGAAAFRDTPWLDAQLAVSDSIIINHILVEGVQPYYSNKTLYFPEGITSVAADTMEGVENLVIPPTVIDLWYFGYYDGYYEEHPYSVVYGEKGSYAEFNANHYAEKFIPLALTKETLTLGKNKTYRLKFNSGSTASSWKSSDTKVATVDKNGKVTAKGIGTATITATLYGTEYTCKVTVSSKSYTVKRGDTLWSIAARELGSGYRYKEIMETNGLKSTLIHRGKTLYLPE